MGLQNKVLEALV